MSSKKRLRLIFRISTTVTLAMLISASMTMNTLASVSINWGTASDGIQIASTTLESNAEIIKTSDNYYVTIWADDRNGDWDIYGQKIDGNGTEQWTSGGEALVTGTGNQPNESWNKQLALIPDTTGGVIIAYADQNDNSSAYVKKIDSTGTVAWTAGPIGVNTNNHVLLEDQSGGAYLTWEANIENPPSSGIYSSNIYATHIVGTDGSINWNSGQPVSVATGLDDEISPDAVRVSDGIIITYKYQYFSGPDQYFGLRTSKVSFLGSLHPSWSPYITVVAGSTTAIGDFQTTSDGTDGVVITYQYNATDIKAQKVGYNSQTDNFEPLWGITGIDISNATGTQSQPQIISDSANNAIIVWLDTSTGTQEIFAQKIGSDGSAAWAVNGINISNEASPKYFPTLISNGAEGVIIAYIQTDVAITHSDLKAQLLDSTGTPQWGAGGTFVETNSTNIYDLYPKVIGNDNGGAAIAWLRETTIEGSSDIHVQYLTDSEGGLCLEPGSDSFCGTLTISSSTLTFTDIPDSFNFGTIQSGATSHNCTNGSNIASPSYICSTDQTEVAGVDDILKVYDDRDSGGFLVNLSPGNNAFTDGTNNIPLTNLYVLTTLPETPAAGTNDIVNGITYEATGETGIVAPAFVNEFAPDYADISDPATYTSRSASSQFGNGAIVLMDGTLSDAVGRNGHFSLYVNYYLKTDATQLPGNYAIIMTYDLMDSTTI